MTSVDSEAREFSRKGEVDSLLRNIDECLSEMVGFLREGEEVPMPLQERMSELHTELNRVILEFEGRDELNGDEQEMLAKAKAQLVKIFSSMYGLVYGDKPALEGALDGVRSAVSVLISPQSGRDLTDGEILRDEYLRTAKGRFPTAARGAVSDAIKKSLQLDLKGKKNVELQGQHEKLKEEAVYDSLLGEAGFKVRKWGEKEIDEILGSYCHPHEARRNKPRGCAVIMVDLDMFKNTNDTLGHPVGDMVLKVVARAIGRNLRPEDVKVRFGGEEMYMFLFDITKEEAIEKASALQIAVRREGDELGGKKLSNESDYWDFVRGRGDEKTGGNEHLRNHPVTISVGVASFSDVFRKGDDPKKVRKQMLKLADRCLYQAKESGRDGVVYVDDKEFQRVSEEGDSLESQIMTVESMRGTVEEHPTFDDLTDGMEVPEDTDEEDIAS